MSLAVTRLFRARWTEQIHEEWITNLLESRKDITREQLNHVPELMNRAVPDSVVMGYEQFIETVELPDPDDRHVLATAIQAQADLIITFNGNDFPNEELSKYGVEKRHPDAFVSQLLGQHPTMALKALNKQRGRLNNPKPSVEEFLGTLAKQGLFRTVEILKEYSDLL